MSLKPLIARVPPSSDLMSWDQVFRQLAYQPLVDALDINSVRTIFDLGANVGYTSRFFLDKFPGATVYAIEPDQDTFAILLHNLSHANVRAANVAIWDSDTKLRPVHSFRDGKEWATQCIEIPDGPIQGRTFRHIVETERISSIDILKVDIEGAEEQLFKDPFFLSITRSIAIEPHDDAWPDATKHITSILRESGFDTFIKGETLFGFKE